MSTAALQKKMKEELEQAHAKDMSVFEQQTIEAEGTHLQEAIDSRASRRREKRQDMDELKGNEIQLTRESLRRVTNNSLAHPKHCNPNYKYAWLSTSPDAKPNYYDAVNQLGYVPCSINDYPDMRVSNYRTEDSKKELGSDVIVFKEMILCKIHVRNWLVLMKEYHHDLPNEAAHDIYRNHKNQLLSRGASIRDVDPNYLNQERDKDESDIRRMGVTTNNMGRTVFTKEPTFENFNS